jgi:geranylgeranyl diphosphate synthase, type II
MVPEMHCDIDNYLEKCRAKVSAQIDAMLPRDSSSTGRLYELMREYPLRPGKALRPSLSIAVCRARGGDLPKVLLSAAALELYHNAFLIHDDIEDQSEKRRAEPTLHQLYGLPMAVNVGDAMLAIAIQPLLDNTQRVGLGGALRILSVVSRMARETAEGQMMELDWRQSSKWTQADSDYIRLVYKKTSWYSFVAPLMIGAISAGVSDGEAKQLGRTGIPLGIAFQIQDDVLNLAADAASYGKDFCGDLWEGKHTLILIHALRTAPPADKKKAEEILLKPQPKCAHENNTARNGGATKSEEDVRFLRNLIEQCGSLAYARAVALKYATRFQRELQRVSGNWAASEHKTFLFNLAEFTINRVH